MENSNFYFFFNPSLNKAKFSLVELYTATLYSDIVLYYHIAKLCVSDSDWIRLCLKTHKYHDLVFFLSQPSEKARYISCGQVKTLDFRILQFFLSSKNEESKISKELV